MPESNIFMEDQALESPSHYTVFVVKNDYTVSKALTKIQELAKLNRKLDAETFEMFIYYKTNPETQKSIDRIIQELAHNNIHVKIQSNTNTRFGYDYIGQVNQDGRPHGIGIKYSIREPQETEYLGYFENGKMHGMIAMYDHQNNIHVSSVFENNRQKPSLAFIKYPKNGYTLIAEFRQINDQLIMIPVFGMYAPSNETYTRYANRKCIGYKYDIPNNQMTCYNTHGVCLWKKDVNQDDTLTFTSAFSHIFHGNNFTKTAFNKFMLERVAPEKLNKAVERKMLQLFSSDFIAHFFPEQAKQIDIKPALVKTNQKYNECFNCITF